MKGVYPRADREEVRRRLDILHRIQQMPLPEKISIAKQVIKAGLENGPGAVLYSGGRDSTVLLDLVTKVDSTVLVMHNNTTLGDPKLLDFIRQHCKGLNYHETTADDPITMWQDKGYYPILSKRGFTAYKRRYPNLKVSPVQCCYQLKEKYANQILKEKEIKVVFWGNRADESMRRRLTFVDNGFLFQPKKYKWLQAYPLQHWRTEDIEAYIADNIPGYPSQRAGFETGCLCCGTDITHHPNNLGRLYQRDPVTWEKYMRAGFAEQILIAQGHEGTPEQIEHVLNEAPAALLRI